MDYTTHEILLGFIYGIVALLAGLTLLIVSNKAWRETIEALDRRRRAALEPALFEYIHGAPQGSVREHLPQPLSHRDQRLAEAILLDASRLVKGDARERVTVAFETLGLVREGIRGLTSHRWWRRAGAAERLGLMGSKTAVEPLAVAMGDPVGEVRMRAARALGIIRGSTSIRPLVQA